MAGWLGVCRIPCMLCQLGGDAGQFYICMVGLLSRPMLGPEFAHQGRERRCARRNTRYPQAAPPAASQNGADWAERAVLTCQPSNLGCI